jgi:membrane-bound lytic murein transglycosylase D
MTSMLAIYLEVGLAMALAGGLFAAVVRWGGRPIQVAASAWAALGWGLVALAIAAPLGWRAVGVGGLVPAKVEVWGSHGPVLQGLEALGPDGPPSIGSVGLWTGADGLAGLWVGRPVALLIVVFLLAGVALALGRCSWQGLQLRRLCAGLPVWKRIGKVRLCVSDRVGGPFAARSRGLVYIVIPTALLVDPARLRLVIAHEVAHHRRGDLLLAPWAAALRALFFWNPLLVAWEHTLRALEDLACDSQVLRRPRVSPSAYGQALLWAIDAARGGADERVALLGGRAMASPSIENLRRRILMLNRGRKTTGARSTLLGAGVLVAVLSASWAVRGAVSERQLGAGEIVAAAAKIQATAGFTVLTHERVVATLNRRLATPDQRAKLKEALGRMNEYRPMIDPIFAAKKLPRVLIAVGLQESGFDNQARTKVSAGIWQFIPATGRAMGLEVTPGRDERLDPKRSTEAAAAYFEMLYQKFGDWPVAIAAYNAGSGLIESLVAGLSKEQARKKLLESDTEFGRYLVGVMASVILSENPGLVD